MTPGSASKHRAAGPLSSPRLAPCVGCVLDDARKLVD